MPVSNQAAKSYYIVKEQCITDLVDVVDHDPHSASLLLLFIIFQQYINCVHKLSNKKTKGDEGKKILIQFLNTTISKLDRRKKYVRHKNSLTFTLTREITKKYHGNCYTSDNITEYAVILFVILKGFCDFSGEEKNIIWYERPECNRKCWSQTEDLIGFFKHLHNENMKLAQRSHNIINFYCKRFHLLYRSMHSRKKFKQMFVAPSASYFFYRTFSFSVVDRELICYIYTNAVPTKRQSWILTSMLLV